MTDHLPPADARASAWVAAYDTLRAAQKLKIDPETGCHRDTLPDAYWALLAEAAIYADLGRADQTTGFLAGGHLTQRDERIRKNRHDFERVFGNATAKATAKVVDAEERLAKARRDAVTRKFTEGQRVYVKRGDWAGRYGQVYAVHPDNEPVMVDVELDPPGRPDDPNEPVMICVPPADLDFVFRVADANHHCEYDDPSKCGWPGHRR